jgi:hypothetical protein
VTTGNGRLTELSSFCEVRDTVEMLETTLASEGGDHVAWGRRRTAGS